MGGRAVVRTVLFLLVAVGSSSLATAGAEERGPQTYRPRLRLLWTDLAGAASFVFPFASREAAAILGEAGIAVEWTVAAPMSVTAPDELRVLVLEETSGAMMTRATMGCTRRGSRTAWVYLSNVLWALGLRDGGGRGLLGRERDDVGRALGRVVAHEIVHILAPDLRHSHHGLMADRLSRTLLVGTGVSLTAREARAARAGAEILAASPDPSPRGVDIALEEARARRTHPSHADRFGPQRAPLAPSPTTPHQLRPRARTVPRRQASSLQRPGPFAHGGIGAERSGVVGHIGRVVRILAVLAVVFAGAAGERFASAAESIAREGVAPAPLLRLVWIDVLDSAPFAFRSAASETSAILAGAGVETAWTLGDVSTVTTGEELKIVLMAGAANGARLPDHVMGGTRRGAQSHTTWVYLSNVLWALGLKDKGVHRLSIQEEEQVARALGRVVAHEIVHAVAPHLPHRAHGLMAEKLGRAYLLQPVAALSAAEQTAFRAALDGFDTVVASGPVALAAGAGGR